MLRLPLLVSLLTRSHSCSRAMSCPSNRDASCSWWPYCQCVGFCELWEAGHLHWATPELCGVWMLTWTQACPHWLPKLQLLPLGLWIRKQLALLKPIPLSGPVDLTLGQYNRIPQLREHGLPMLCELLWPVESESDWQQQILHDDPLQLLRDH